MCPLEPDCENSRQVAPITVVVGKNDLNLQLIDLDDRLRFGD